MHTDAIVYLTELKLQGKFVISLAYKHRGVITFVLYYTME